MRKEGILELTALIREKKGKGNTGHGRLKPYLCSFQISCFSDLPSVVLGARGSSFHWIKISVSLVCRSPKWNDLSKFLMYVTLKVHLLLWKSRQLSPALLSAVIKAIFQWEDAWKFLLTEAAYYQAGALSLEWHLSPRRGIQCQRRQAWSTSYTFSWQMAVFGTSASKQHQYPWFLPHLSCQAIRKMLLLP